MILREIKNIFIKNRLTEGVDFKRYEWLRNTNNRAYLKLTANLWNNQLHTIIGKATKPYINTTGTTVLKVDASSATTLLVIFRSGIDNQSHIADYNPISTMPDIVDFKFYINNNVGYCERNGELFTGMNMQSYWNDNVEFLVYAGKMKLLEEYDSTNDKLISSLVPCQLLKPIPATLDANNIARSAGECGMYDSISGKFFGNVANSGTFTVTGDVIPETHTGLQQIYQNKLIEGVDYETADWLRSTGGAKIELNYTNNGDFNIELKGKELQATGTDNSQILGTTFQWSLDYLKILVKKNGKLAFENVSKVYPSAYQEFELKVINSSDSNFTNVIINGDTYNLTAKYPLKLNHLFYWYSWGSGSRSRSQYTEGCVGHLKVDNYCDMYPCQLIRSIPRNLDAQCKERVAGECGMIDLISGKFYGNVANSGTFTVENDNNE